MASIIEQISFANVDFSDKFFDSLKADYPGFLDWANKKSHEGATAFLLNQNGYQGFLYLKEEESEHGEINPPLPAGKILKIGTFKVEAHGTKIGERFIKTIFDFAMQNRCDKIYVTIYAKHQALIELLEKYGFQKWGMKSGEDVYIKIFSEIKNDIYKNYPRFNIKNNKKYLLSIYPKYHTPLFADSQLRTEKNFKPEDITYTNSIQKVYLCSISDVCYMQRGDLIVIYRTKDNDKSAEYSSVATSIAVVENLYNIHQLERVQYDELIRYSVFSKEELEEFWQTKKYPFLICMLYNVALPIRITRHDLIESIGIERSNYWGFFELQDQQFRTICNMGGIDDSFIIN